ncbi:MAG: hypothetical protein AMXMBFR52_10710 [Burkholderiales bacterium]
MLGERIPALKNDLRLHYRLASYPSYDLHAPTSGLKGLEGNSTACLGDLQALGREPSGVVGICAKLPESHVTPAELTQFNGDIRDVRAYLDDERYPEHAFGSQSTARFDMPRS